MTGHTGREQEGGQLTFNGLDTMDALNDIVCT